MGKRRGGCVMGGGLGILGFGLWILMIRCGLVSGFGGACQKNTDFYGCCSPLQPSSCQSVRMDFLAVSPGVPLN